jgi:hypothetical protein
MYQPVLPRHLALEQLHFNILFRNRPISHHRPESWRKLMWNALSPVERCFSKLKIWCEGLEGNGSRRRGQKLEPLEFVLLRNGPCFPLSARRRIE